MPRTAYPRSRCPPHARGTGRRGCGRSVERRGRGRWLRLRPRLPARGRELTHACARLLREARTPDRWARRTVRRDPRHLPDAARRGRAIDGRRARSAGGPGAGSREARAGRRDRPARRAGHAAQQPRASDRHYSHAQAAANIRLLERYIREPGSGGGPAPRAARSRAGAARPPRSPGSPGGCRRQWPHRRRSSPGNRRPSSNCG